MRRIVLLGALATLMAVLLASPAQAATLTVNSTADTDDGACTTASGGCTLREAIDAANPGSGAADTIDFALGSGATITLASELPTITAPAQLTIDGGDADITINGDNLVQALQVSEGAKLNLANLTLTRGYGALGGAIENSGMLTVSNSTFSGNTATEDGGGIFNFGSLAVSNSTFSGNRVTGLGGSGGGGGIANGGDLAVVSNSTFFGNRVPGSGGAIYNASLESGGVGVFNSTIANNSASGFLRGGGAISDDGAGAPSIQLSNTVVAHNAGGDCNDNPGAPIPVTDNGNNLDSDGSCLLSGLGSLSRVDPKLGPLADNGGYTHTMALLPGSPAINAGNNDFATMPFDQRGPGFARIVGPAVDMGAYEVQNTATGPRRCTVTGTRGADTLLGTARDDVICGLGGADTLMGQGGEDVLRGGGGPDALVGGPGSDGLRGGAGTDALLAKDGVKHNDTMNGGAGRDRCRGDRGDLKSSC